MRRPALFYGWYIVAASVLLMAYSSVVTYGFTAFINPIATTFGWSYATISLAVSLHGLETGALNPFLGMAVDRWGRAKTILASLALALVSIPTFVFVRGFVAVLLVRAVIATATAFFVTACSALMADTVPRDMRGRVMAALGRGTVFLGAASGGTGGPGVGFVITIPLMLAYLGK